jgi:iron only hydrogenase large subunit-like protein
LSRWLERAQIDGAKVMSFASAYGFRNIQNITRQTKSGTGKYDYVEVMACPSGTD